MAVILFDFELSLDHPTVGRYYRPHSKFDDIAYNDILSVDLLLPIFSPSVTVVILRPIPINFFKIFEL